MTDVSSPHTDRDEIMGLWKLRRYGGNAVLGEAEANELIDAYDGLVEQLEASRRIVDAARVVIEKEGLHGHEDDEQFWRTKKPYWIAELRRAVLYPASERDEEKVAQDPEQEKVRPTYDGSLRYCPICGTARGFHHVKGSACFPATIHPAEADGLEPDQFVTEPIDLGIPIDDEKVAQKIEDRKAVEEGYFRDDYPDLNKDSVMIGLFAFMFIVGGIAALTALPSLLPAYLVGLAVIWLVTPTTSSRRNRAGSRREERD